MWKMLIIILTGLSAGTIVAVAQLSFMNALGIYSRVASKSKTASYLVFYENVVAVGLLTGSAFSVFKLQMSEQYWLVPIAGFFIGCYVGNLIMGLAEVLDVFPVLFRRARMKEGLAIFVIVVAIGKLIGSYGYFFMEPWKLR